VIVGVSLLSWRYFERPMIIRIGNVLASSATDTAGARLLQVVIRPKVKALLR
jgi:hypothetical protein